MKLAWSLIFLNKWILPVSTVIFLDFFLNAKISHQIDLVDDQVSGWLKIPSFDLMLKIRGPELVRQAALQQYFLFFNFTVREKRNQI